jgi:hypothetical protein
MTLPQLPASPLLGPAGRILRRAGFLAIALVPVAWAQTGAAQRLDYWVAPGTGLMWAAADNGFGVSWTQASNYCRALTLGGYKDWTLPEIDDLQRLFGGPANQSGYHVTGPLKLTGWQWSSSPGRELGEQWALDFGDGGRASVAMGDSGLNRALCVRRPPRQM